MCVIVKSPKKRLHDWAQYQYRYWEEHIYKGTIEQNYAYFDKYGWKKLLVSHELFSFLGFATFVIRTVLVHLLNLSHISKKNSSQSSNKWPFLFQQ